MSANKNPYYVHHYKQALLTEAIDLEESGVTPEWVGERFGYAMNAFKAPDVEKRALQAFAPELYFNDTWHTHESHKELGEYLKRTGERVHSIDIVVDDVAISKTNAYVRWNMTFIIKAGDEPIKSVGMTHMRFNEKREITTYQDYWDGVEGFYRTLPVLGGILAIIRKKLG